MPAEGLIPAEIAAKTLLSVPESTPLQKMQKRLEGSESFALCPLVAREVEQKTRRMRLKEAHREGSVAA